MKTLYEFTDYKEYFNQRLESLPKKGHGEYRRLALFLNVSTTMISQVFRGDKHLSLEMASELCDYLQLDETEAEYLFLLVDYQRAGSHKLRQRLLRQIQRKQQQARVLENRIKKDISLTEESKSIFYSNWLYSAIRILSSIPDFDNIESIADRLQLPTPHVQKIAEFLIQNKLCLRQGNKIKMGPTKTYVGSQSPFVVQHHRNWRLQAFQKMNLFDEDNLFTTAPMSMSKDVAEKIRQEIPGFIQSIYKQVEPSDSQVVRCLNIDWFEY